MTRLEFVAMACAMGVRPVHESNRREHVEHLRDTVEALADALGLGKERSAAQDYDLQQAQVRAVQLEDLVRERDAQLLDVGQELAAKAKRIVELEQLLEQATAPAAQKARRP